jgi:hypothetical protein
MKLTKSHDGSASSRNELNLFCFTNVESNKECNALAFNKDMQSGSAIPNGMEPKSCLGRVFNSKLSVLLDCTVSACYTKNLLELNTRPSEFL